MLRLCPVPRRAFSSAIPLLRVGPSPRPCRPFLRPTALPPPLKNLLHSSAPVLRLKRKPSKSKPAATSEVPPDPTPPVEDFEPIEQPERSPNLIRNAVLFSGFVAFDVFLWASIETNRKTDELVARVAREQGSVEGINNGDILAARTIEVKQTLERWGASLVRRVRDFSQIPRSTILDGYVAAANKYLNAPDALKVCWGIIALNGAVYLAWKVPRFTGFMMRNFQHNPIYGRTRTLLTSVFSHHGLMHLFFNCYALSGFGYAAGHYLLTQQTEGPSQLLEATSGYHFLAFFVTAGLFSSLASHVVRVKAYDAIVRRLAPSAPRPRVWGSLGASGAIYSCVTLTALAYPHLHINILLIPVNIPIQVGVGGMMLLDVVGLIRGWGTFDHIAHLGGAIFGLWYYLYGPRLWDGWRATSAYLFGRSKEPERKILE